LRQHEQKLNEAGIKVSSQVCRGEPVKMVERAARSMDADLLVLSTHGKSGIEAFWSRSFAPNLARIARHPILFVPV
jgi:nucleotide-binding universal stress UspA family protein